MSPEYSSLLLSARLALTTTVILLTIGMPLAWWLSRTRARARPVIETIVSLPLVLPPTVMGFYLLILFNPQSPLGSFWVTVTGSTLAFSFEGLVLASCLYSLPFAVQPMQAAFEKVSEEQMEAAAGLGASPFDAFVHVALPLARRGVLTAGILSFAHTLGEFGIVLMVGGNIPGETRVISIEIYEQVERLAYDEAHRLSLMMLIFSFVVILASFLVNRRGGVHVAR